MREEIEHVLAMLAVAPDHWRRLSDCLPAELLNRKPASEEWSAIECLQHLVDTERVFQFRVSCFQKGSDFPAFNPDQEGTKIVDCAPAELASEFSKLRSESLQMLETVEANADLDRRVRHLELGLVSLREMLFEWAAHDLDHTMQAERALIQPFVIECGAWNVYYTAHLFRR